MIGSEGGGGGGGCHPLWGEIGYMLTSMDSEEITVLTHKFITFKKTAHCCTSFIKKIKVSLYASDLT